MSNMGGMSGFASSDLPLSVGVSGSQQVGCSMRSGSGSQRSAVTLSHASSTTKYRIRTLEEKIDDQRTQMAIKDRQIDCLMSHISESGGSMATSLASIRSIQSMQNSGNMVPSSIKIDVNTRSASDVKVETTAEQVQDTATTSSEQTISIPAVQSALPMVSKLEHPDAPHFRAKPYYYCYSRNQKGNLIRPAVHLLSHRMYIPGLTIL